MKYIVWIIAVLIMVSCAKGDEKSSDASVVNKTETTFLINDEAPTLKLTIINEEKMVLRIMNQTGQFQDLNLENSLGEVPSIDNYFYTKFCNQSALVVMIRQGVNTGVSHGYFYWNVLINTKDGTLIKVIEEGKVKDKETGEIISNGQKLAIAQLMSGKQSEEMCVPR